MGTESTYEGCKTEYSTTDKITFYGAPLMWRAAVLMDSPLKRRMINLLPLELQKKMLIRILLEHRVCCLCADSYTIL